MERPARTLPILYFGAAYAAPIVAMGTILSNPRGVAGFFYTLGSSASSTCMTAGWAEAAQHAVWLLWATGVPLLAAGLAFDWKALLVMGAAALEIAVVTGGAVSITVLRHAVSFAVHDAEHPRASARELAFPARHG